MNLEININIPKTKPIVIGCSSGPDSMALLHYLKNNTKYRIICCHINHNIRKESLEEEKYLENYCHNNNIIFEKMKIESYNENNFENEARKKRYNFYEKILKKYNTKYLFLAHHGDDLIETILMKINRGSNLEGYAGIKEISKKNNYYIIRPLLKYTKKDLIEYNKTNNIKYYIDNTNDNITYTRNRYRKKILPFLKKEDKNIHLKYLKYSKTLQEYQNYIDYEINIIYDQIIKDNTINIKKLIKLHPFLQKNLIYKYLNNYYQNTPNIITEEHIKQIIKQINNTKPNITINLPNNNIITRKYNTLSINNNNEKEIKNYKIKLKEENIINNIIIRKIDTIETDGNDICRLNSKDIKLPLYLRNRKNGDFIKLKGTNGKKKIKEIFIEKKIPIEKRNTYPLLVDSNDEIIWIPNIKKSKFNRQKNEFCDIILNSCEKEEKNEQ